MPKILILCTGNSCRSHIVEGFLRKFLEGKAEVVSAGSHPAGYVHPLAIKAMAEVEIDLSNHESKNLSKFQSDEIETVITVCGNAEQACPTFPGAGLRHHYPFDDPADAKGSEDEQLAVFRRVRDEIRTVFAAYADGRLSPAL